MKLRSAFQVSHLIMWQRSHSGDISRIVVGVLSGLSLVVLFLIRLYSALYLTPVITFWDDSQFRYITLVKSEQTNVLDALTTLLLPGPDIQQDNGRLLGYCKWLLVGQALKQALGSSESEIVFQLANIFLLLIQAITVLLFARWSTKDWPLSFFFCFLWISSPLVFGMSRWVWTENLVLTAGPIMMFLSAWLLEGVTKEHALSKSSIILRTVFVAYMIGVFSNGREYSSPTLFVTIMATTCALIFFEKILSAFLFVIVLSPFMYYVIPEVLSLVDDAYQQVHQPWWFRPISEWAQYVVVFLLGPAQALVFLGLLFFIIYRVGKDVGLEIWRMLIGVRLLWVGYFLLLLGYFVMIVWSTNRTARASTILYTTILGLALIGIQILPSVRNALMRPFFHVGFFALITLSWITMSYQLWYAFDGGKDFAISAVRLETINCPLNIPQCDRLCRPVDSPPGDVCPWDASEK